MNPFDLRGPAFLVFYLFASMAGIVYLYLRVRGGVVQLPSGDARRQLRDPYLMAFLRGGVSEALQTVAFSLYQRKLLIAGENALLARGGKEALQAVENPLELSVLAHCSRFSKMAELMRDGDLAQAVRSYAEPLRANGLVANDVEMARRRPAFLLVAGALLALSVTKIYLAIQRGHSNLAVLVMLTALALFAAFSVYRLHRTNAGNRALLDQQTLFERLKNRVHRLAADGATNEAVLVAATFGLAALPGDAYPFAARLRKQARDATTDSSSSCGSGCGGGGCGGGCGGCGS